MGRMVVGAAMGRVWVVFSDLPMCNKAGVFGLVCQRCVEVWPLIWVELKIENVYELRLCLRVRQCAAGRVCWASLRMYKGANVLDLDKGKIPSLHEFCAVEQSADVRAFFGPACQCAEARALFIQSFRNNLEKCTYRLGNSTSNPWQ